MRRFLTSLLVFAMAFAASASVVAAWTATATARENGHGAPLARIVLPLLVPTILIPHLAEVLASLDWVAYAIMAAMNGILIGSIAGLADRFAFAPRRAMLHMAVSAVILVASVEAETVGFMYTYG